MRACWLGEREGKPVTHTTFRANEKTPALPSGTPAFLFASGGDPSNGDQLRRNRLTPYTSADSAVIQKLVGQSV
jgi:hypothetical protein